MHDLREVYEWEQTRSQGLLLEVDHPTLGTIELPGPLLRFFDADTETTPREYGSPPLLNEHSDTIRRWLHEAR